MWHSCIGAGKKWKRLRFLTRNRKRWLLIWGSLGLVETLVIAGVLWGRDFPEFEPDFPDWAGRAASSALNTLHLYNVRVDFMLGFLFEAIGEIAIGVAFAALVWWIFSLYSENAETAHKTAPPQRYVVALLASACVLGIANRIYSLRPPACYDCFAPHGLPFTYFHEGGFAGGEAFVWSGVVGDALLILSIGVIAGWIWNRISQNHSPKAVKSL